MGTKTLNRIGNKVRTTMGVTLIAGEIAATLCLAAAGAPRTPSGDAPSFLEDASRTADRVCERVAQARANAGLAPLERRSDLDAAARRAAAEVALSGGNFFERPIDALLREEGITGFDRVVPLVQTLKGYRDPAGAVVEAWRAYPPAWTPLMSADFHAVGFASVTRPDGRIVVVGIVFQAAAPIPDPHVLERRTVDAINDIRVSHGLVPLESLPVLQEVARAHSEDMIRRGYFGHRTPDGDQVDRRVERRGIPYACVGENISRTRGAGDPVEAAVEGWMDSRGHRTQILTAAYAVTGVGVAIDDGGVVYFTQVFLEPPAGGRSRSD